MDTLEQIAKDILACKLCELRMAATAPVPGNGQVGAKYLLIGEAPGSQEDKAGCPFVGLSGQRLDKLITLANIDINECYLSNVCRCRPPDNRTPTKKEIKACLPFLHRELQLVAPVYIITLGSTPLSLFSKYGVSSMHGTSFEFALPDSPDAWIDLAFPSKKKKIVKTEQAEAALELMKGLQ